MKETDKKEKIEEVLTRGVSAISPSKEELRKKLSSESLRVYLGVDPTGPNLHLGHLTNLLVLKRLQNLGHEIIFLIGDFTAQIGDPSGKVSTRRSLTEDKVKENMSTFKEQVSHIISFVESNRSSKIKPAEIKFNSKWYKKMPLGMFMKEIGYFTVRNMLQRDMFKARKEDQNEENWLDAICLKELVYPILQGYDGVVPDMDVDIEVGGNDQIFNMSIGRALRVAHSKEGSEPKTKPGEKFFIATTLLVNPKTGKKLMNKSEGGLINLDDPPAEIFGKVMALDDYSMFPVAEFCTEMDLARINELRKSTTPRKMNPRDAKMEIAEEVVRTIYGEGEAQKARLGFERVFSKKDTASSDFPILPVDPRKDRMLYDVIVKSGVVKTKSRARILIKQGSIQQNGKQVEKNPLAGIQFLRDGDVLKIGKHSFFRVKI